MGIVCSCACCYWCPCIACCGFKRDPQLALHPLTGWMKELCESKPEIKLNDIIGVASHDSGTYTIPESKCCSGLSITQSLNLRGQLDAGARVLDYRYGSPDISKSDCLRVQHGIHSGEKDYCGELQQIADFLKVNPREFIVIEIRREWGSKVSNDQLKHLINSVSQTFGEYMINSEDLATWASGFPNISLKKVLDTQRRILVLTKPDLFEHEVSPGVKVIAEDLNKKGFFLTGRYIKSEWHDRGEPQELMTSILEYFNKSPLTPEKFLVNQFVLTPQASGKDIMKVIFCCGRLRVDQKVYQLLKERSIQFAVRELANNPNLCMVMLDFIHFDPYINHFLVGLNFKMKLTIKSASCVKKGTNEHVDVLAAAQKLVKRDNTLWIVDFRKDLGIKFAEGNFLVTYSFDNPDTAVVEDTTFSEMFQFGATSMYLLNELRGELDKLLVVKQRLSEPVKEAKEEHQSLLFKVFVDQCKRSLGPAQTTIKPPTNIEPKQHKD